MLRRVNQAPTRGAIVISTRILANLYRTDAAHWESIFRDLERGEGPMKAYYAPLFQGILAEMRAPRSGRAVMDAGHRRFGGTPGGQAIKQTSCDALEFFTQHWLAEFPHLIEGFPDGGAGHSAVPFNGFLLRGGFHALAEDGAGRRVLLAFHASKWPTPHARAAFVEMLAVIAEERHAMGRDSVRLLDFRAQEIVTPPRFFIATRRELSRTCEHYARTFRQ